MTGVRNLNANRMDLVELEGETLYTKLVVEMTPECKALLAEAERVQALALSGLATEQKLRVVRITAEVQVSLGNRRLDALVAKLRSVVNQRTGGQSDHPLYRRFFSRYRPSEVIRMSLATELPVVEAWLESLKSDPDAELAAVGAELAKETAAGRQAVLAQATARQALRDFEAGERLALFSAVNTARTGLYAALRKLNDDVAWVESFFRPTPRRAADEPEEPSVAEAQTLVKSREAELTTARAQLDAAQKREMAAQAAAAARDELTRERDAKKKEVAALMARVAELEGELGSNAR